MKIESQCQKIFSAHHLKIIENEKITKSLLENTKVN